MYLIFQLFDFNSAMLSIEASKNAIAASRYFKESLSVEDYYSEKCEITGQWHGKIAARIGLLGEVKQIDFDALLSNINPITGMKLTPRNSAKRRPMYDFTFNAPKSISLCHAITGDDDILQAHRKAVLKAMTSVEADIQTQAGAGKGKHYVTTGNALFAEFIHTTTRPLKTAVNGQQKYVPEPHLHSHCTVINATYYDKQARFRAIELGNVKGQASYYESLYHAYMAEYLKAAGYKIVRAGKRWEISGINRALIDKFSSRTREIEAMTTIRGIKSSKAKAQLGRMTRHHKNKSVGKHELSEIWQSRLTEGEYHTIISSKTKHVSDSEGDTKNPMPRINARHSVDLALAHCLAQSSSISEKRLLAYAIDLTSNHTSPEHIRAEFKSRTNILSAYKNTVKYITTTEMNHEEERLIERAAKGKNTRNRLNPHYTIKNGLLNEGQRAVMTHVLASQDDIIIISGDASVDKATLLQEIRQSIKLSGKKSFSFTPSSTTASAVLCSKENENTKKLSMLLNSESLQKQLNNNVMLIDDAGRIGVPLMNQLLDIAKTQHARVILSGDWKQHSAVERGDALKILEAKPKLTIARVTEIVREKGKKLYNDIIKRIAQSIGCKHNPEQRRSNIAQAFNALDKGGSIVEIKDEKTRYQALADEYLNASAQCHDEVIVIASIDNEAKSITNAIRKHLKRTKRIGQIERDFSRLHNHHYTKAQKQLTVHYIIGNVVEFHQHVTDFKAGQQYVITGRDVNNKVLVTPKNNKHASPLPLPFEQHHAFDVYQEETIQLSVNDRLRITKNSKSIAGRKLHKGQVYTIKGFDEDGHIMLSNGEVLSYDARHINHGYVTTTHTTQSKNARTVFIAQSAYSFTSTNDKQFYDAISHGVENCFIYTDDKAGLKEAIINNGNHMSASEIAKIARQQKTKKRRRKLSFNYYLNKIKSLQSLKSKEQKQHGQSRQTQRHRKYQPSCREHERPIEPAPKSYAEPN